MNATVAVLQHLCFGVGVGFGVTQGAYVDALKAVVEDLSVSDPAMAALMLASPPTDELVTLATLKHEGVNPALMYLTRHSLRLFIANALQDQLRSLYDSLTHSLTSAPFSLSGEAKAQRQLRCAAGQQNPDAVPLARCGGDACALANLCFVCVCVVPPRSNAILHLLTEPARDLSSGSPSSIGAAESKIISHANSCDATTNMTDRMAALSSAVMLPASSKCRQQIVQHFASDYSGEALAMNSWLRTVATACTVPEVEALSHHPSFNIKNPNKVYSLYGGFLFGNPLKFHAPDGSGYSYLTRCVTTLDAFNPQGGEDVRGLLCCRLRLLLWLGVG